MADNRQTIEDRRKARDARFFTGRNQEITAFEEAIQAVKSRFSGNYQFTRTIINISGEGGMGKTTLLREYERICGRQAVPYAYLDMRRYGEPAVRSLVDFMRIMRAWSPQSKRNRMLGQQPFTEFDEAFERLSGLEKRLQEVETKSLHQDAGAEFAQIGANLVVGLTQELPLGKTAVEIMGEDALKQGIGSALKATGLAVRERLIRVFGKIDDADFYLDHEDLLVRGFVDGIEKQIGAGPFALMLDSYEDAMTLDIELRDRVLDKLPQTAVVVISGRNSILNNCSLSWRDSTHFFKLGGFTLEETVKYLSLRKVEDRELARNIQQFTFGVPLAVGLAANIVERFGQAIASESFIVPVADGSQRHQAEIIAEVAERFIDRVPGSERELIEMCAVVGTFAVSDLREMFDRQLSQEEIEHLGEYSFIRQAGNAFVFHDLVRRYVLHNLKMSNPDGHRHLQEKAATYFEQERSKLPPTDAPFQTPRWCELTLNALYHRLQADMESGLQQWLTVLSDASWENEKKFILELLDVPDRLPQVPVADLADLKELYAMMVRQEFIKAADEIEKLLKEDVVNPILRRTLHDELGTLYSDDTVGRLPDAVHNYERAADLFEKSSETERSAWTRINQARCYWRLQQYDLAEKEIESALSTFEGLKNQKRVADLWNALGVTYREWGKQGEALAAYAEAKKRYETLEQQADVANVLWGMGLLYRDAESYERAAVTLAESFTIYHRAGKHDDAVRLRCHRASALAKSDSVHEALPLVSAAIEIAESHDYVELKGFCHETMVDILAPDSDKLDLTRYHHRRASDIYQKQGKRTDIADVHVKLGKAECTAGNYAASLARLDEALLIYADANRILLVAKTLKEMGKVHLASGKMDVARENLTQAVEMFELMQMDIEVTRTKQLLAKCEQ